MVHWKNIAYRDSFHEISDRSFESKTDSKEIKKETSSVSSKVTRILFPLKAGEEEQKQGTQIAYSLNLC